MLLFKDPVDKCLGSEPCSKRKCAVGHKHVSVLRDHLTKQFRLIELTAFPQTQYISYEQARFGNGCLLVQNERNKLGFSSQ